MREVFYSFRLQAAIRNEETPDPCEVKQSQGHGEKEMQFAVIPLIVWALIAAFGGGALVGGGIVAVWPRDPNTIEKDPIDENGIVQNTKDPMRCVDLYYKAVIDGNYSQYQFCVLEPMPIDQFNTRVKSRLEAMQKSGLIRVETPVKGRTEFKKVMGKRGTAVFAISPWTNKEESFVVVEEGQGWRIAKENLK